jgi:5-methylcytosine-specific restriction endonuclease McrA
MHPTGVSILFLPHFKNPRQMAKKPYDKLLQSPDWQRKRLEILQRDNFTCTLCGDNRTTLHVHHTEYEGLPWEIPNEKLTTLCAHCHTITHKLPDCEITRIHKQISLTSKCWEVVAFCEDKIVFLYMFFSDGSDDEKLEIITVFTNLKNAA